MVDARMRAAAPADDFDAIVHRMLAPATLVAAVLFGLVALGDILLLDPALGRMLVLAHAPTAALFAVARFVDLGRRVPQRHANAALAIMTGVAIVNAAIGLALSPDVVGSFGFVPILFAAGSTLLSTRWMVATVAAAGASWATVALITPFSDAGLSAVVLALSALVALFVHQTRFAVYTRMLGVHARLRDSEASWRLLVESAPDVILKVDVDGRILFSNRDGGHPEKVLGSRVYDWMPEHEWPHVGEALRRAAQTGRPTSYETTGLTPGGAVAHYKASVGPLFRNGQVDALMIIATDMTEQRRAEEERTRAKERQQEIDRLREVDAFRTRFINSAAHELGTPLTPIRMQIHLLKVAEARTLTPGGAKSLDILDRNVVRLSHLLKDVLDAARLQAGRLDAKRAPVDLAEVAREVVETFEPTAQASRIRLELRAPAPVLIDGDATRLTQVLFNLVSNALKFTPEGGSVTVDAGMEAGEAVLRVTDTGAGIPQDALARLFTPFTRLHEDEPDPKPGNGLGLYISRGIVEQHHGRLWAHSEGRGRGSAFTVALPLGAPRITAPPLAP